MATSRPRYTRTAILDHMRATGRRVSWVAEQMGISRWYLYAVANGKEQISERFVADACRVLDVDESVLFFCDSLVTRMTTDEASVMEAAS